MLTAFPGGGRTRWVGIKTLKTPYRVKGERGRSTFVSNKKNSHRNTQRSYLLSKCLHNLFPGLLERSKCQMYIFFGTNSRRGQT